MPHDPRNSSFAQNLHEESIEVMASIRVFEFEHRFHPIIISSGLGNSSAVGPDVVGQLASAFLDTLYKA